MIERFRNELSPEDQQATVLEALKKLSEYQLITNSGNGVFNFSLEASGDQWSKFGGPVFVQVDISDEQYPAQFVQSTAYGQAAREEQKEVLDRLSQDFRDWLMETERYGISFNPILGTGPEGNEIYLKFYQLPGGLFETMKKKPQATSLGFALVDGQPKKIKQLPETKKNLLKKRAGRYFLAAVLKQPGVNKVEDGRLIKLAVNQEGNMRAMELRSDGYWRKIDLEEVPEELLEDEDTNIAGPLGLEEDNTDGWEYNHSEDENKLGSKKGEHCLKKKYTGDWVDNQVRKLRREIAESGTTEKFYLRLPSRGGPKDLTNPDSSRGSGSTRGRHKGRGKVPGGKRRF